MIVSDSMFRVVLLIMAVASLSACGHNPNWEHPGLVSPAGWAKAYVAESNLEGHPVTTQVMLEFERWCGAGSVQVVAPESAVQLRWVGPSALEVEIPDGVEARPASDSHTLNHRVRCMDWEVEVEVVWSTSASAGLSDSTGSR